MSTQEIINYMKELIAEASGETPDQIDENLSFFKIGISSVYALKIMNKLRKKLQVDINPVAMFEYKTIADMAGYLHTCVEEEAV
ncbi:MAG TPA: acyl carrier protein [Ruminococcus sp.]|nr:acyl carrier protein [Ruminococcus sp.]